MGLKAKGDTNCCCWEPWCCCCSLLQVPRLRQRRVESSRGEWCRVEEAATGSWKFRLVYGLTSMLVKDGSDLSIEGSKRLRKEMLCGQKKGKQEKRTERRERDYWHRCQPALLPWLPNLSCKRTPIRKLGDQASLARSRFISTPATVPQSLTVYGSFIRCT